MGTWNDYKYEEKKETNLLKAGNYRASVLKATEGKSKSGNDMITVELKINGYDVTIRDYFVKGEYFNGNISRFFDSFTDIPKGNFNFIEWAGAIGAVKLKEDDRGYLRVKYYLTPAEAEKLPDWVGEIPERQTVSQITEVEDDNDIPF